MAATVFGGLCQCGRSDGARLAADGAAVAWGVKIVLPPMHPIVTAALVLGPPAPLELLLVGGVPVVEHGELRTVDVSTAARDVRAARLRLAAAR